jgi:PAS domain S-box-containing protein
MRSYVKRFLDFFRGGLSRESLEKILEESVDGIVLADEKGRIHYCNRSAERMLGYTQEEMIGNNVSLLMPEPHHSRHDAYIERYLRTGESRIIGVGRELTARCKDGSLVPIDVALAEVWLGRERYFCASMRSLAERKRAEAIQVKNREIEAILRTKEQLLQTISDRLKAPLVVIMAHAEKLQRAETLDDEEKRCAAELYDAARVLKGLITGVLDVVRLQGEEIQITPEAFDLLPLVQATLSAFKSAAEKKGLSLDFKLPAGQCMVRTDRQKVEQVLVNLLDNAVRFTEDGGVYVQVRKNERDVRISIRDTGKGMSFEEQQRIAEPFASGGGCGLAVSCKLARLLGGRIGVESEPGRGSTFTLLLPLLH